MATATLDSGPVDISSLDLDGLRRLQKDIDKRIRSLLAQERQAAFRAVEETARRHGLTRADVVARFGGSSGRPHDGRVYRNPANPDQTWNGRGRRPSWVESHLTAGGQLEDLAMRMKRVAAAKAAAAQT